MALQEDIKAALEEGRDDVIRVLAEYRMLPEVVGSGSGLLGGSSSPTFGLDPQEEGQSSIDRQTTVQVVDALGMDSEDDCEAVREEIRNHPAW